MSASNHRSPGFTLIELLVVIAIIAILAAILFPVFSKAREKARQTACTNNQRQIVTALMLYAQDYEETLPEAPAAWGAINLDRGVLKCPSAAGLANGYFYNNRWAGEAIAALDPPDTSVLLADGLHQGTLETTTAYLTYDNVFYKQTDLKKRHGSQNTTVVAYGDGHVQALRGDIPADQLKSADKAFVSTIVKPVGVTASTEYTAGGADRKAINAINGSGLSAQLETGDALPATWPTHASDAANTTMWMTDNQVAGAWIRFDLGSARKLSGFRVWNFTWSSQLARCAKAITVAVSSDGTNFTDVPVSTDTLAQGAATYSGETVNFTTMPTAQYVRITIGSNYNDASFVGLSEVRFFAGQ